MAKKKQINVKRKLRSPARTLSDITERKRAEEALQENEARYRDLVENSQDLICTHDLQGNLLFVNEAVTRISGYSNETLLKMNLRDVLAPQVRSRFDVYLAEIQAKSQAHGIMRIQTAGGEIRYLEFNNTLRTEGLPTPLVRGMAHDITARVQAEDALRVAEEKYRTIFEGAVEGIFQSTPEGCFLTVNPALARMWGYASPEELISSIKDIGRQVYAQPQRREEFARLIQENGEVHGFKYEVRRKDGEMMWVSENARAVRDASGTLLYYEGNIEDITERVRAEEALRESEKRFRSLIENASDLILILNPDHTIAYVSPSVERILGHTVAAVSGARITDFIDPPDLPDFIAATEHRARTPGPSPFSMLVRVRHADGSWRVLEGMGNNLLDQPGVSGLVINARDITERKRAEEEIRHRADEFAALYDTARDLAEHQDLPTLLQAIVDRAALLLAAPGGGMYLYDKTRGDLHVVVSKGSPLPVGARVQLGEGMAGRVAQTHQPLIVNNYQTWEGRSPQYEGVPIAATIEVPMIFGGELIGVLVVFEADETARKFTEADVRLLSLFASSAAGAVHNARLLDETRRRADEFAALYNVTHDLAAQPDLDALLNTIVQRATELLATPSGTICLYDPAHDDLVIAAAKEPELPVGTRIKIGEGAAGIAAQTRAPLRVADYSQWEHRLPQYDENQFGAAATVPMLYGGELIGTLNIVEAGSSARQFTEADLRLLTLFAGLAAGAVHNANLLDETRARAEQLTLLYDAGLTLNRTLEPRAQLELLCTIATKALHADNTAFFRYDTARNDLGLEFGVGLIIQELDVLRNLRFPLGAERGLIGWVAQTRVPLNLPDVTADPRWIATDPTIRSALWVPVLHDEQLLGVLSASSTRRNAFTSQDERLFVLFANQVAVAIENARLFGETRQRLAELEAVNHISTALRAATTLEEMLPRLLDETLHVLDTDAGALWFYDPSDQKLHSVISRGWFARLDDLPISLGEGTAGHVLTTGQPYVSREYASDPITRPSVRSLAPAGAGGVTVPIRAAQEIIGVLYAGVTLPREITESEVRLLTTLAEIAGNAIHRTRLHKETVRRLEILQALHTIDAVITASFDLRMTLNVLLEHVATQLQVDAAAVLLLDPRLQTLDYAAGRGFRTNDAQNVHIRLGEDFAGRVALERRIVQVDDSAQLQESPRFAALWTGEAFANYYGVPLIVKGQVKGVLEVYHRAPFRPDPDWIGFLETLAGQAALAIDNAQLFENLENSNVELTLAYDTTIEGWSHALDLRDKETEGHTQRVTETTLWLAKAMGIRDAELVHIRRGALLHDIGKMGVPDRILLKPDKLTDAERKLMRQHPQYAYDLLSPIAYLGPALDVPYCHHEKWDGTGYPRGLAGEQIPLAARLFAIADVWDAVTSDRPYRAAWSKEKALAHIHAESGRHFDPRVVEIFLREISGA